MTGIRLFVVLILSLCLSWDPVAAFAQAEPEPTPSASPTSPQPEEPGLFDFDGRVRRAISEWFRDLLVAALRPVFDLLGRTVFSTPAIGENQRVRELWGFSLGVADATLLMFVLAGAAFVTVTGGTEVRVTAKEVEREIRDRHRYASAKLLPHEVRIQVRESPDGSGDASGVGSGDASGVGWVATRKRAGEGLT